MMTCPTCERKIPFEESVHYCRTCKVGHCERCDPVHDHRPPRDRLRLMEGGGTFHASPTRKQAITRNKEDA